MGNSHETITADQLREKLGVQVRTWQVRWNKTFQTPYDKNRVLELSEIEALSAKKRVSTKFEARASAPKTQRRETEIVVPQNETQANAPNVARKLFNALALIGIASHAVLIWYDCSILWGVPGFIGGAISFLLISCAVALAMSGRNRTSGYATTFAVIVDLLAGFVHYPVFKQGAKVTDLVSVSFAVFLCAGSAVLLFLFTDEKVD